MASKELAQTRRYQVSDFPPGTKMMVGDRRDLDAAIAAGRVRAVGRFNQGANGVTSVPVVYVARRTIGQAWYNRRGVHIAEIVLGALLSLAALSAWAILVLGLAEFLALVIGVPVAGAIIVAYIKHRGGTNVSVTTTTTTNVRVKR